MPKKAPSIKNRIWERDRRNRFNASFEKLAALLPQYNPKTPLSKVLIVQKATELIQELQLNKQNANPPTDAITQLQNEILLLNKKCSILTQTLEKAGLQLPVNEEIHISNDLLTNRSLDQNRINPINNNGEKIIIDRNDLSKKISTDAGAAKNSSRLLCVEKKMVTSMESSEANKVTKGVNINKNHHKKNTGTTTKILETSKPQVTTNGVIHNPCPIVIIVNDSQTSSTSSISNFKIANRLTIVKNAPMTNLKMVTSPLKNLQGASNIKSCHNNGMKKIASKGLKADLNNAIFMNKVPIPALNRSPVKTAKMPLEKKLGSKIKQKKIKRVTYRMLRQSKILKRKVAKKTDDDKQKESIKESNLEQPETKDKGQIAETTKGIDENLINLTNIDNSDKENKNNNIAVDKNVNNKTNDVNHKSSSTSVSTYSIDSICNANLKINNLISSTSKIDNSHAAVVNSQPMQICEKITELKKDDRSPCIDNNSKCDPLSDLSNDIFASLQVAPIENHQTGCTSPTAAFLLAFPLVSSLNGGKVNQVIDENIETPEANTSLLQIGNQKTISDSTSGTNILNLDQFSSLFSSKELYKNTNQQMCEEKKIPKNISTTYDVKSEIINIKNIAKEKSLVGHEIDNQSTKPNTQCLYTYGIPNNNCIQNNLYNSCFEGSTKPEKNKFSHTNIINDNSTCFKSNQVSVQNKHITTCNIQIPYGGDMNYTQAKASSTNLTYSTAISQSEPTTLAPSYNNMKPIYTDATNLYNAYTPFYNNSNKEKSTYLPTTSVLPSFNSDTKSNLFMSQNNSRTQNCDNAFTDKGLIDPTCTNNIEKNKISYQEQDKDSSMRYKPYAFNSTSSNHNKIKRHDSLKEDLKEHSQSMKPPVNWMTTPDIRPNSCSLPKLNMQNTNNFNYSNLDFNVSGTNDHLSGKEPFFIVPPNNINDNLNMWNNPVKMQDSQLNLPTTLPTLIGDLALGTNTFYQTQNNLAKQYTSCYKEKKVSEKEQNDKNAAKITDTSLHSNSWSGNFSVSQLVDQYKSEKDLVLNNNERRHFPCSKQKYQSTDTVKKNVKYDEDICIMMESVNNEADIFNKSNEQNTSQNNLISKVNKKYSAEALLSDDMKHDLNVGSFRQQQFFPFVDFSSDIHQPMSKFNKQHGKATDANSLSNVNYSYSTTSNNFTYNKTTANNSSTNSMEINTLGNKLLHLSNQNDAQTQFFQQHNVDNFKPNIHKNSEISSSKNTSNLNNIYNKKPSRKNKSQENNMIDFNYLPGNHSPVLTDDSFYNYSLGYSSNTSSQNYQNQNLLYSGNVRSHINQHHTIPTFSTQINSNTSLSKNITNTHIPAPSPSITNTSSLTNFNLSTIFPEINDKIRSGW